MTANEAIRLAQQGDAEGFNTLYRLYYPLARARCRSLMHREPENVEDVVQNCFLKLHRRLRTFRYEANFSTWFFRLVTNEILMHLRRQQTEARQHAEVPFEETMPVAASERMAENLQNRELLTHLFARVSPVNAEAVVKHYMEDKTQKETAAELGVTLPAAKARIHRGVADLRRAYAAAGR